MSLRKTWQAHKFSSEEAFKKAHATEMLKVHTEGVTGYPIKFDLGLGPVLDNLESAQKKNKPADIAKYKQKAKEIVGKYRTRVTGKKNDLGNAWNALNEGLAALEKDLK